MRTAYVAELSELVHRVEPVQSWGYLVSGEARAVCSGRSLTIRAGEAFWLPAHSFISWGSGTAVVWRPTQTPEDAVGPANATGGVDVQFRVDDYVRIWTEGSRRATETLDALLDVPYGSGSWQRMDVFPACRRQPVPVVVFLHGGGWSLPEVNKDIHRFPAPAFVGEGMAFVTMDYPLVPESSMEHIVSSVMQAIAYLAKNADGFGIDPQRIYAVGHSAGGHLVAELLSQDWSAVDACPDAIPLMGGCAISGIFELKNDWIATWNDIARFRPDEIARFSPLFNLPRMSVPLLLTAGGADDPEFHKQIDDYARAWGTAGLDAGILYLPGLHHMNELLELARPESGLFRAVVASVGGSERERGVCAVSARCEDAPIVDERDGYLLRTSQLGDAAVSFIRMAAGLEVEVPSGGMRGGSDDTAGWAYLIDGGLVVHSRDGDREVHAGELYAVTAGSRLTPLADCRAVEFVPCGG